MTAAHPTGRDYARLLRLSNAPTALADVGMGYAVATGSLAPSWLLTFLALASLCFYHAGMALNDAVDAEQDTRLERVRPIAEGRLTRQTAYRLAAALGLGGFLFTALAALDLGSPAVLVTAGALALMICGYNTSLKRTVVGPLLMGGCRVLNAMLGMAGGVSLAVALNLLPGIFAYIVGLTVFARDEAIGGRRTQLTLGALLSAAGVLWLAVCNRRGTDSFVSGADSQALFWIVALLFALRGMAAALLQPTPSRIGRAVGIAIQGLVVIDATITLFYAGPMAALAILALLPVAQLMARGIPPT
ncbi:UbiA family prenyltransferase [Botrimarina hoheduenensis]|uniref:Prenyltransferase n=1 Tax=Botrimarina hoheduenensis TaxID=2528000 RepID=A0A5C5VWE1_9BACT|nr:UbiA family prenyltransferase [Botrimarina hoheduenensis]TWT42844.1 prenyltransferase [Botrimarina hoheduenensis]